MTKKLISIALVIVTVFSVFAITANAASYKTGNYAVATAQGLNVRPYVNASTRLGAASNNVRFTVTEVDQNWGFTPSIKLANGRTVSGWLCLDYCSYKGPANSSRSTYNDVFASTKGSGYSLSEARKYEATSFNKGTFIYVWGFLHDENDNLYKSYGSGTCDMTLAIYRPDGSCAFSHTYKNSDNNWIGQELDQAGTWKIQSKITGSLTGTNTRSITVKEKSSATYYSLTYNANGGSNAPSAQRVKAGTTFNLSSSKPTRSGYNFLGWATSKSATSAPYAPGISVRINSNVTLYAVWKKNSNVNPSSVSLNHTSCTMNAGNTLQLKATVYPSNATDKSLSWSSNDSDVVTVSSNGKLTAKAPGVATVTVKTSNGKTKSCTVTVRGVEINGSIFFAHPTAGDIYYLSAKAYPSDTTKFKWSTSNSKVVSISSSGKMTAKSAGTATITVTTPDGRSASRQITVSPANKWRTGNFDSGYTAKGYTTVRLNENAGDAKIKIYTYNEYGNKTSGEIHVVLRDWQGNWICEFDAKSGDTLNLGDDYGDYRVYISRKRYPDTIAGISSDWTNTPKCHSWAIECTKNCYI